MKLDFAGAAAGLATTASLQDQINVKSVLNSIQTYATPGAISGAQHGALESTLHAPIDNAPLLYNAPYVAPAGPVSVADRPSPVPHRPLRHVPYPTLTMQLLSRRSCRHAPTFSSMD